MRTKVSIKGRIVLPVSLRKKFDIRPGDELEIQVQAGRIVLIPPKKRPHKAKIVIDSRTGLPALDAGPDAPILTSKEVTEILGNFP